MLAAALNWRKLLSARLFAPVNGASLSFFRIAFGSVMLWETWRLIQNQWVEDYFSGKEFYFTYPLFGFVQPWPPDGMYLHLVVMGLFACFIALGFLYRFSAACFFLMFTYLFLLEQARYLNHFYLICLLSFLLIFLPAHRRFSLDALLRPGMASATAPAWALWLLRFQIAVPMIFGGIAKLNGDWLRGEPLRAWLSVRTDFPLIGPYFTQEPVVWVFVYGGLLIDLLFLPAMLYRRTRPVGVVVTILFHLANARLFSIGIFPWLMIAATLVFFPADWPARIWADIRQVHRPKLIALACGFALGALLAWTVPNQFHPAQLLVGGLGMAVAFYYLPDTFARGPVKVAGRPAANSSAFTLPALTAWQKAVLGLLGLWMLFQVLVPLRHLAIPGNVHWTEEGHNFAWHMKLRDKESQALFLVVDRDTGEERHVDPADYLTPRQTMKMSSRPSLALRFARYLEGLALAEGSRNVAVYAHVVSSLNGRPEQLLIDPDADLTQPGLVWLGHAHWILPLETPLPPRP